MISPNCLCLFSKFSTEIERLKYASKTLNLEKALGRFRGFAHSVQAVFQQTLQTAPLLEIMQQRKDDKIAG